MSKPNPHSEKNRLPAWTRILIAAAAVLLLIWAGFAFGVVADLHLEHTPAANAQLPHLGDQGDAPRQVRLEVLTALRAFQQGYVQRDPKELDSFMQQLFLENDDILLLGTDPDEWVRGYQEVKEFIRRDWEKWGDFRIPVDDSVIWSSGDIAWTASLGTVRAGRASRRVRFLATLRRTGPAWRFRQLHFQWDDPGPRLSDLFRPSTHLRLAGLISGYFSSIVRYHFR